ncbi:4-hydroxy-tetrahydrodipicolinate reductase [Dyella sp. GSA-30]|uniref:4-hydroxy-tetrahydrodipicolinate reductase n=1 Tax=Dyella sp. GSA-30 TaxID=2994496 RepID=UPI002490D1A7|nr:4-hydroxy-tetrahydrodipicolinate reductase [Dyella sp. GSA-30]BDU22006.1 4-hydroxy-tetrahydrodipicolinate reductase [Dyella sp. GSA-30]
MPSPIRLAVNGATGRMGQALLGLLRDDKRFELCAAISSERHAGKPVFPGNEALSYTTAWPENLDVVIDFSGPEGLVAALDYCEANKVALVTGTTGIDDALAQRLNAAPIAHLRATNFSLGVAVLTRLLRQASAALRDWDLEIVEAHHNRKEDAPSGTALSLGKAAAQARGTTLEQDAVYTREGRPGPRKSGTIGFAVVRGGDIVGEHSAMLIGQGERVELGHRATDRSIFARGAIEAAHWLAGKPDGAYDLDAMLAERSGA